MTQTVRWILAALTLACEERHTADASAPERPAVAAHAGATSAVEPGLATSAAATSKSTAVADAGVMRQALPSEDPGRPSADAELAPSLLAPDGTPLPQTQDRPSTDSPGLRLRLERLVEAIAKDEPEHALPAFFPRLAYERVKAVADPGRDWEQRLVRAFRRDIHDYHRLLGSDAEGARLAGLSIKERSVRWMEPGTEGNRTGYYRVTRSRLRLRLASGTERELELTSLISWRGAWYVVHLHGFG